MVLAKKRADEKGSQHRGQAENIPLFAYLYHEYGPVRLDGWGKLSPEVGELFYWVASRVALWGGLFELNYEWSPLEVIDGQMEDPAEHYYDIERRSFGVDPAKAAFVREIAHARTGFARDYLVYGTMVRPLAVTAPEIELDYFLYNAPRETPHAGERGRLRVPATVHAGWRSPHGALGFLFVNLQPETAQALTVAIDTAVYGLDQTEAWTVNVVTSAGRASRPDLAGRGEVTLALPPRRVVLLEIGPARKL